jgi:hypothetical protein
VPALTSQNSWCVVRFHMFEYPEHSSSRTRLKETDIVI